MTYYKFLLLSILTLFNLTVRSQDLTQNIRGRVLDKESKTPLIGATIVLMSDSTFGAAADESGYFKIGNVPLGRHKIKVQYLGYEDLLLSDIVVNTGKETILNLEMEQLAEELSEVSVTGISQLKHGTVNEMATVSARSFSVNETERYAGSRGDPARMASNFAGVQGSNDARNDIVIRGNSPMGLLWRLNDIDIPNPNHFAVAGTSGGPVSIINNKVLGTSDFFTGAFPAEYGNSIAGVFDLKMRKGNDEKHEFTGQLGFLGTELSAEGPLSKKTKSSYLFNYRYSTLALFSALKLPLGTSAVPRYQDMSFNINLPTKKLGEISLFAIGGSSKIDIVLSDKEPSDEIYGQKDRDQYFRTSMGVIGINHLYSINKNTFSRLTVSTSIQNQRSHHIRFWQNTNFTIDSLRDQLLYKFSEQKLSLAYSLTKKLNFRHTIKAGLYIDRFQYNFRDSIFQEERHRFETRLNSNEHAFLLRPYVQWKYNINTALTLNAGLHSQYFTLNKSFALEPRLGLKWKLKPSQSLNFGYGLHSQLQPSYIYFHQIPQSDGRYVQHNRELGFIRSHHFALGYDNSLTNTVRIKIETYYQALYNVPVTTYPSSFSLVNQGTTFSRFFPDSLTNKGTGTNYGVEFTLEKFFAKNYFFMFTSSLYDSKYKGSDGVERNTDFNGKFSCNVLVGSEYTVGKRKRTTLITGAKITWAGGRRYGPVDIAASDKIQEVIYADATRNSFQFRNYFRTDLKVGFRRNNKQVTHEVALDLVNIFGVKNLLGLTYSPDPKNPSASPLREEYQLGFLPLFYYRIDF
ncbi:MAG TPA: TonB-dependent receptor [Cytophagaceae bacterium]|jgi:hypothetical protein